MVKRGGESFDRWYDAGWVNELIDPRPTNREPEDGEAWEPEHQCVVCGAVCAYGEKTCRPGCAG